MSVGYIGATIPAKTIHASDTTLFRVAMVETGNPLQFVAIAELNGIVDPWVISPQDILIPPIFPTGVQTGLPSGVS